MSEINNDNLDLSGLTGSSDESYSQYATSGILFKWWYQYHKNMLDAFRKDYLDFVNKKIKESYPQFKGKVKFKDIDLRKK